MAEIIEDTIKSSVGLPELLAGFDTATLYEAAGRRGMVDPAIRPAWMGAKLCGRALTVVCPPGDNLMLHRAVSIACPGDVIVANVSGHLLAGAWGEILSVAAQARGVAGLAIDGAVRDIEAIARLGFPVFSRGLAIGSCTKTMPGRFNEAIDFGGVVVRPGDIVAGGADGMVSIDQASAAGVYQLAAQREKEERVIIEKLRKGKTTLELLGLSACERPGGSD